MQDKPDLQDDAIIASLQENYGLSVLKLEFLPLGADANAGVYGVNTDNRNGYFLKVRRGEVYKPGLTVPHYLFASGIHEVVAPLATVAGNLWTSLDDFTLILYPFIDGKTGMEVTVPATQWTVLGTILKRVHTTPLPPEIQSEVARETFSSEGQHFVRKLQEIVRKRQYADPNEQAMAALWNENRAEITRLVDVAEGLAAALQKRSLEFVLCHSDIHSANMLITEAGDVYVVDWDNPILAPKERDLMFIGAGIIGTVYDHEETAFYRGYGEGKIDYAALAYYRYERIVQDFMEFGNEVFYRPDLSSEHKRWAVDTVRSQFQPGAVIDMADRITDLLPPELRWK
jgi:spectinomycin phosphotransferase